MRTQIIISTLIILTFASCKNSSAPNNQKQETPKALQDKSTSYEISYSRGTEDLVHSLYNELLEKTPELKQLENEIDNIVQNKIDSTKLFGSFNGKNQAYYQSANGHVEKIKDSVLKNKMKLVLENGLAKYNSSILAHTNLLKTIDTQQLSISDLHTVLKITRTMQLIEKYQKWGLNG